MDFFTMKRKKLQTLCKKYGIPANLKNKEMAEKLSLIYKEEKNENPGSRQLRSESDKSKIEIIVLDSDSDTDVQMEALDTVAEKASSEKTNLSAEHLLDEEPDQFLTTSPLSEVKSDLNIDHKDDLDTVAEKDSNKTNVSAEYLLDKEPDQFLTTSPLSEVKSDLNIPHKDDSGTAAGNSDACEVKSVPSRKTSLEPSTGVKNAGEDTDVTVDSGTGTAIKIAGTSGVKFKSSQKMSITPASEKMIGSSIECIRNSVTPRDVEFCDVEENMVIGVNNEKVDHNQEKMEFSPKLFNNPGTPTSGDIGLCDLEENLQIGVNKENIDPSENIMHGESCVAVMSDNEDIQAVSQELGSNLMEGEVANVDHNQEKMEFSPKLYNNPGTPTNGDIGLCNLEENLQIGVNKENTDPRENIMHGESCVAVMRDNEDIQAVSQELGSDLMEGEVANVDHNQEKMEFSPKLFNNPGTPTSGDIGLCDLEENLQIGVNKENIEPSEAVLPGESSVAVMSDNEDIEAVSQELGSNLMEGEVVNVDHNQEKMEFSPKLFNNPGTPTNGDIGLCDLEENLQIGVNKENIDPSEDVMHGESCVAVMSDNEDIQAVSQELGSNLMEGEVANVDDKFDILENVCGSVKDTDEAVNPGGINSTQGVSQELGSNLIEGEVANVDEKFDIPENVCGSVKDTDEAVNPGGINSTQGSNVNTDLNTDVTGEDILDEVHSSSFEDSDGTPGQFLPTDLLSEVETSDLDVHQMFVTATASKTIDTSGVKFESSQKMSLSPTPEKMFGSSTKLLNNSGTPTNYDIGLCDVDENLHIAANEENIDPSDEILHAEPSLVVMSDDEEVVLEELGNYLMGGEDVKMDDKVNLIEDVSGTVDGRDEAVNQEACEEEMLKSSEKTCMVADREEHIGFEAETYFDSTTLGDVMETCNMKGSMQADMMDEENNQEDCISAEREVNKFLENSNVHDDIGLVGAEDENQAFSVSRKRKSSDVDDNSGANSGEVVKTDVLVPAVPQSSEMESCDIGLQQLFAQGTPSGGEDANQKKLDSQSKATSIASGEKSIIFTFNESSMMHKEIEIDMIEEETNQEDYISAQREVSEFFDNSDVHADIDRVGAEDENQAYSASWKRSDVDDTSGANSDEELKANELVPAVLQSSETESCDFGLEQLFAQDTASSGDLDACQKKLDSPSKATPVANGEKRISVTPKLNKSSIMPKEMENDTVEEENNQEVYITAHQKVSKFFDNSDVRDDIGRVGAEDENQAYSASLKRKRSDVDDTSGASLDEEVKADELVPAVPQSCETESCNFGLQDTALGVQDACKKKLDSPSKATPIASGEKRIIFTPKLNESSMMHKEMEIVMMEEENNQEDYISAQREVSEFLDNSDVHDDTGRDGAKDENEAYLASLKRSDVDDPSGANSDEEMKANELVPAVPQSSETESCDFGLQQLFAQDTASSGDQDACQKKLDSPSKATPVASGEKNINFTPKLNESSMMHKEKEIAMMEEENNQEDYISPQREVSKFFDDSNVHDNTGRDGAKDENQAYSASLKRKRSDVDDTSDANSDEEVKADELVPAVPQSSETESCDFGLQQLFAQDTASSGDQDACQKKLDSPSKATPVASGEKNINFTPKLNESSMMNKEKEIAMMEEENNQEDYISPQREVSKFFDDSGVHDDTGRDGGKDENQAYSASLKRKWSDVDDTSDANSDEEVKADELVPAVPLSSEMESCNIGLQPLFATDTASGDEDAYQKKLDSSSKGTPIARGEKSIFFTPKHHESSMMHKKMKFEMNLSLNPARDSVGTCDMKENIKTDKKEEVSSMISRNKFAKRLPLQDLQQN